MKKTILYLLLPFLLISCMHTAEKPINSLSVPISRYKVWKILVEIFKTYPLKTIDEQLGYIETEVIKSGNIWKPPHQKQKDFSGYSYILKINLNYTKPISSVTIRKKANIQKGFLSKKQEIASDGLEEASLIYKINRELEVQSILNKLTN
ncbi:MAG: hypothetical protein OXC37_05215 [Bdellovibrionaceae bacterium]|nr:hypothetical protein [Pseudobdellovibrionaceae bacterium]